MYILHCKKARRALDRSDRAAGGTKQRFTDTPTLRKDQPAAWPAFRLDEGCGPQALDVRPMPPPENHMQILRMRRAMRVALIAAITLLPGACGKVKLPHRHRQITHNWTPAQVQTVAGVPAAAIDTAIAARLAADRPKEVPASRWEHVQRLYKAYDGKALWMESEGPNRARTNALLQAIASADSDALRMDKYPLTELVQTIGTVRETKAPTAEQLANADVLLTTAYIALSEDLLSGQTNPKDLAQDWPLP
jgi:murein L,D-transpeptidase YcbB/YkuD